MKLQRWRPSEKEKELNKKMRRRRAYLRRQARKKMSRQVFDQIAEGLKEAIAVAKGEAKPYKLTVCDRDLRDSDPSREGIFRDHNCWRCRSGELPCVQGHPRQCEYPHARND